MWGRQKAGAPTRQKATTCCCDRLAKAFCSVVGSSTPPLPAGALRVARRGAVKARAQATNQLKALLLTGPAKLRETLRHLSTAALIDTCARLRRPAR